MQRPLTHFANDLVDSKVSEISSEIRPSWDYRQSLHPDTLRQWIQEGIAYFSGREPLWLPEYEAILQWMLCNEGKGLILSGDCGLGKTLITTKVIPLFLHRMQDRIPLICSADKLKQETWIGKQERRPYIVVDDVGTQGMVNDYGTQRDLFAELIDHAEKRSCLVVLSTNLDKDRLKGYGARTYDRLRGMCRFVALSGQSLRGR